MRFSWRAADRFAGKAAQAARTLTHGLNRSINLSFLSRAQRNDCRRKQIPRSARNDNLLGGRHSELQICLGCTRNDKLV